MDSRQRLLEAAIECLQRRGYAHTTTREIVAAAGSHLPAINYYFGSKERLLHEAVVEALRRWAQTTMAVASEPSEMSPRDQLFRSIARFLGTLEADRPYVVAAIEAFAQAERSDELRERLAEAYGDFRVEVAHSLEAAAGTDAEEPRAESLGVASLLIALFDGLAIQWLLDPDRAPDAEEVGRSLDLLAAAMSGEAVASVPAEIVADR